MLPAPFSSNSGNSATVAAKKRRLQLLAVAGVAVVFLVYYITYVGPGASGWALELRHELCIHKRATTTERGRKVGAYEQEKIRGEETAVIVMDMWDHHCCEAAEDRAALLAPHINNTVSTLREKGALIVHIPHNVIDFYKGTGARKRAQQYANTPLPNPVKSAEARRDIVENTVPPVTVDNDPRMTCLCEAVPDPSRRYTRQTEVIHIDDEHDAVTSDPQELHGLFQAKGIKRVLYMGVHLNICVLWYRQTSLIPVSELGYDVMVVRDLTDVLSEVQHPEQLHSFKNAAMLNHIEQNWAPTIDSSQILRQHAMHCT